MLFLQYYLSLQNPKCQDDIRSMQTKEDILPKKDVKRKALRKSVTKRSKANEDGIYDSSSSSSDSSKQSERSKINRRSGERRSEGQVSVPSAPPPSRTISCPQLVVDCSNSSIVDGPSSAIVSGKRTPGTPLNRDHDMTTSLDTRVAVRQVTRKTHVRSRSDVPGGVRYPDIVVTPSFRPLTTDKAVRRRSLLEEGGSVVMPTTECFFPQPEEGQSLTSFLSSENFQTCAEMDRENAHFYISEALISAMEQIRCKQVARRAEEEEDDSDEEIQHLKQRIRIRRCERQQEKARQKCFVLLSDGKTDTTTSQSASSPVSPTCTAASDDSSLDTDDDVDQLELSDTNDSTLSSMKESGLSLSMASLYSDADIQRVMTSASQDEKSMSQEGGMSAEGVALCLLKKFSEKQLPKASDLEWLVSEQEVPQKLLPLPDSWPISPDDAEQDLFLKKTRLRGTADWAPPRAQIIFNIHPEPNRKLIVARQKYRCAGCSMKTDRGYVSRFRYCEYLGKYFCQCCHSNKISVIPGRILRCWDFSKYPVSNFSHDLLDRMHTDPLFNVIDVNSGLYRKSSWLESTRNLRLQMFYLKDFLSTCKLARRLSQQVEAQPRHWFCEPHLYSLQDLEQVKQGRLPEHLRRLVTLCVDHVLHCPICKAKGFICETCRHPKDIIYPFQLRKVIQCRACGACFHRTCFQPQKCAKCARIEERRRRIAETIYSSDEEHT